MKKFICKECGCVEYRTRGLRYCTCFKCGKYQAVSPKYRRLSSMEKKMIEKFILEGVSMRGIARALERQLFTIRNYLKKNSTVQ